MDASIDENPPVSFAFVFAFDDGVESGIDVVFGGEVEDFWDVSVLEYDGEASPWDGRSVSDECFWWCEYFLCVDFVYFKEVSVYIEPYGVIVLSSVWDFIDGDGWVGACF